MNTKLNEEKQPAEIALLVVAQSKSKQKTLRQDERDSLQDEQDSNLTKALLELASL